MRGEREERKKREVGKNHMELDLIAFKAVLSEQKRERKKLPVINDAYSLHYMYMCLVTFPDCPLTNKVGSGVWEWDWGLGTDLGSDDGTITYPNNSLAGVGELGEYGEVKDGGGLDI